MKHDGISKDVMIKFSKFPVFIFISLWLQLFKYGYLHKHADNSRKTQKYFSHIEKNKNMLFIKTYSGLDWFYGILNTLALLD